MDNFIYIHHISSREVQFNLKDMIEEIISTDKKSRESIEHAKQLKIQSAQKLIDMKEQKRREYLEKARANIKVIEQEERVKADAKLEEIEEEYKKIEGGIDEIYKKNYEPWVKALVKRVIEG